MAPSDVNDGARELEAIIARWHKDLNSSVTTAGTSTAYTYAANQTLSAYYDGLMLGVDFHTASGASPTINVDSLGAKSLVWPDGTAVASGEIPANAKALIVYDGTNFQILSVVTKLAGKGFLDEDDLSSDSDTDVPSQQSVKAYVDGFFPVTSANIGTSTVTTAKLKTTTGDLTETTIHSLQTGPGGEFGFWPTMKLSSAATDGIVVAPASPISANDTVVDSTLGTSFLQRITTGEGTTGDTLTVRQRYIQASPPYDLGDGEVPVFIFARVNSTGEIEGTYIAPDPPWANNGPTNIKPDFEDHEGRKFKKRLRVPEVRDSFKSAAKRAAFLEALKNPQTEFVEIDQAMKQADMPLIPHPWIGNDLTGKTIVLLDPVSDLAWQLFMLHEGFSNGPEFDESIGSLLHDGYLKLDNEGVQRGCPPGVMACSARWK